MCPARIALLEALYALPLTVATSGSFAKASPFIKAAARKRYRWSSWVAKRPASYRDPKPRNPKFLEKQKNSKIIPCPVLLFLGLFENSKENLKNTKDLLTLRTLKNIGNYEENTQKTKENPSKRNTKETKIPSKRRTGWAPTPNSLQKTQKILEKILGTRWPFTGVSPGFSDFFRGLSGPKGPRDHCKWTTGSPYMREIGTMWQIGVLTGKPSTFLAQNGSFSAFWHYKNKERLSRGLNVKWHSPTSCLDASRK